MSLTSSLGLGQSEFDNHLIKAAERDRTTARAGLGERTAWAISETVSAVAGTVLDRIVNISRLTGGRQHGRAAVERQVVIEAIQNPIEYEDDLPIVEEDQFAA